MNPADEPAIDPSTPHSARVWNYWQGGKDNYQSDRVAGDQIFRSYPAVVDLARAARLFLCRAVRYTAEAGVRQFLDIGAGLPTIDNTHQVAQRIDPTARVVYVDNDPVVLVHARARLTTTTAQGVCDHIDADLRDPDLILDGAAQTLDWSRPVTIVLLGILDHLGDDEASDGVRRLLKAACPGSHLILAHLTSAVHGELTELAIGQWNACGGRPWYLRPPEEIAGFFDGLELLGPGVVSVSRWRPEPSPFGEPAEVDLYGGVARSPGGDRDR